jgi:predicted phosphate transport protein (TIGR00153 family)
MFKKLIPTDAKFFEMFGQSAKILQEGAKVMSDMVSGASADVQGCATRLERLEHDADVLTHEILIRLDKSFITPIDREDIHQLTLGLDDCMDYMEAVTERMMLYGITQVTPPMKALVEVIVKQAEALNNVMPLIADLKYERIIPHCIEINRLENLGDKIAREAVAELFKGTPNPLEVMKWRDIYDNLETATDEFEHVAGIIEGIVLKHG